MGKNYREKYLTPHTLQEIKEQKVRVVVSGSPNSEAEKYSKEKETHCGNFFKGYSLLENQYIVRTNIQKKYGITIQQLEVLLKAFPMQIFTYNDFFAYVPKSIASKNNFNFLKENDFLIKLVGKSTKKAHYKSQLYTLSVKGKNAVMLYYAYLSGEKPIPTDWQNGTKEPIGLSNFNKFYRKFIDKINESDQSAKAVFYQE